MRKIIIKTLLVLCLMHHFQKSCAQVSKNDQSDRVVRVLTFNIYHGEKYYSEKAGIYESNIEEVSRIINELKPDLVAFQEVDFKTNRAKGLDLVTEIGVRTGMAPIFGKAMNYDGGAYGEAVLSKYTFQSTKVLKLPASEGKEPRAAMEVIVELPCKEVIRFVGTHLDHTAGSERLKQAQKLNEYYSTNDIPSILAGDLNALPESETMKELFKVWKQSSINNEPTIPATNPTRKIDYILFKPAYRWRILENRVIKNQSASDHNPVLTVFELVNDK